MSSAKTTIRALPKLSPPRLQKVVVRERLFTLIDQAMSASVVWIGAAAGSGKTTAVASYLASRKQQVVWFQVDRADNDPATFFHYLAEALRGALPRKRFRFPQFEPEYQRDPIAFALVFFRYLGTRLTTPLTIVFDNAQEIGQEKFAEYVLSGVRELPQSVKLIVVNRESPSTRLVRLVVQQQLTSIDATTLQFTLSEVQELIADEQCGPEIAAQLLRKTEGWVAALILLREGLRRSGAIIEGFADVGREKALDYFATEIFDRLDADIQEFLLHTAHLPVISHEAAIRMTGNVNAAAILQALCRRNVFT